MATQRVTEWSYWGSHEPKNETLEKVWFDQLHPTGHKNVVRPHKPRSSFTVVSSGNDLDSDFVIPERDCPDHHRPRVVRMDALFHLRWIRQYFVLYFI